MMCGAQAGPGATPLSGADAVVLAAGESRRMGRPKMLLPWGEATVLEAVVRSLLAAPVNRVAVVLGHRAAEHRAALCSLAAEPRVLVVDNPRYGEGMLTSVQAGVAALMQAGTALLSGVDRATGPCLPSGAVVIALGDQPLITPGTVARVLAGHGGGLTVPTFAGRRGHPVCVDRRLLGPLLALNPDEGLRGLFAQHPEAVVEVPVPTDEILLDVDTPDAYRRALTLLAQRERGA